MQRSNKANYNKSRLQAEREREENAKLDEYYQLTQKDFSPMYVIKKNLVKDLNENIYMMLSIAKRTLKQLTKYDSKVVRYDSMEVSEMFTPNLYAKLVKELYFYDPATA